MFKSRKISKNAEFHADFEFVEKVVKMHQKNVISKTFCKLAHAQETVQKTENLFL
jgi:hypothetical protein